MKIFVTGAAGYIGSAVCELLRTGGHKVVGLARSEEKARVLESLGYVALRGSLADTAGLRSAAAEADAVVHAALEFGPSAGTTDRAAVATLIEALAGTGKALVYSSGVWVMGNTRGQLKGEVSALAPPPMVAWRPAVEELVLESKDRGVKGVVLRPGTVYGRKSGRVGAMFREAQSAGRVSVVGNGENHWSTIHVDDLADLYVRAVTDPAPGELFIACGGMPQPVGKIARAVAKACGVDGKVEMIPLEQARAEMGPLADCLAMDCKAGSTKAARYFGWTVRKPSIFDEIFSGSYLS
ncbi:MAG: NAD-dependent epimerase/dehydratase family protein [Bryobacterales bacterium]|nr:NAD-dependent epimerase/dehydratase family protein [Bryobacterales bacterium]